MSPLCLPIAPRHYQSHQTGEYGHCMHVQTWPRQLAEINHKYILSSITQAIMAQRNIDTQAQVTRYINMPALDVLMAFCCLQLHHKHLAAAVGGRLHTLWRDSLVVSVLDFRYPGSSPAAVGGRVATVGQLLFAPWAWAYSTFHP